MRIIERHRFGPHEVVVVENVEDEGMTYSVLVDGLRAEDEPLCEPPSFAHIVRLYDRSQARAMSGGVAASSSARVG